MDERTFLRLAFEQTDNDADQAGQGLALGVAIWSDPELKAQIDAALVKGYVAYRPQVISHLIITDTGRQRLRALGGFVGTPLERVRYAVTPESER